MKFWKTNEAREVKDNGTFSFRLFNTVDELPKQGVCDTNSFNNIYFDIDFLRSIEKNNSNHINFFYLLLYENDEPICFATLQLLDVNFLSAKDNLKPSCDPLRALGFKLGATLASKPFNVLICGNTFISGEYGFCMVQDRDKNQIMKELSDIVYTLAKNNEPFKNVDLILFKDFQNKSLPITDELASFSFKAFEVDPNMVLHLDPNWSSINDYLNSFKAKYRTKANAAFKRSSPLTVRDLSSDELKVHIEKLKALYKGVEQKSSFNLGVLNLDSYIDLKKCYPDNFIVRTYWLKDEMVGFLTGMINGNSMDAHFVGFDYEINKEYAIYARILYNYVEMAIQAKLNQINFGRTAGEIKSTVGAIPEPLTCYIRHTGSITNHLIRPIINNIKPAEFPLRQPFKAANT